MAKGSRPLTMRRELARYVLGLSVLTALAFSLLLKDYFQRGLSEASKAAILMEVRAYEAEYRLSPYTPLPSSYVTRFFLDDWRHAPPLYQQLIKPDSLQIGEFSYVEWTPHGKAEWQDSRYLVIYWHKLPDQRDLFVVTDFDANLLTTQEQRDFDSTLVQILIYGGVYLLLMLVAVWFYNRRTQQQIEQLSHWAESLTLDSWSEPRPDFRYHELNRIAEQLQQAFERIASLLAREHQFLRHASHELRTPVAVVRANMELLDRLELPSPMQRPIERVRRANQTMLQLIETLLWLSRENEAPPNVTEVQVDRLLEELSEELGYLLQDKPVALRCEFEADQPVLALPVTPLRIVLSNLLRNAYQYTAEGEVRIILSGRQLVIENCDQGEAEADSDNSFGLGLMLVQKICERLGWSLDLQFTDQGVRAALVLPSVTTEP
ncbi:sensor histidine kinase [Motiliproteus coralliicola]|uniref:histidine kinase n=1 Tax=Motiliproteus coralliicola TaxID=2283196 RepID=A0A369WAS7_9GAMM|nr:HAMP domain-containing sensor histidine kinase [Motiliproteus coralliicola]RDE18403.1 sensor histidine kinase [Motiliproteus coralliicola]